MPEHLAVTRIRGTGLSSSTNLEAVRFTRIRGGISDPLAASAYLLFFLAYLLFSAVVLMMK